MSDKYLSGQKKNVNKNTIKGTNRNTTDYFEQNSNKHTSSISNKIADLKNGNYVDLNKTDDSKLRLSSRNGSQSSYPTSRLISYCKSSEERFNDRKKRNTTTKELSDNRFSSSNCSLSNCKTGIGNSVPGRTSDDRKNCSSGSITLRRVSRLSNRSISASESSSYNEKAKQYSHSTRHSSLQRSDTDMRQKSLFRSTVSSKQNSPVRELRRCSPRKSPYSSLSLATQSRNNNKNSSSDPNSGLAEPASTSNAPMSDANPDSDRIDLTGDPSLRTGEVGQQVVDDDDSSSVEIIPESEPDKLSQLSPKPESFPLIHTADTCSATVTIPTVITTTPDNICTEALSLVETNPIVSDSDVMPVIQHRRTYSIDDDEDKEKAVAASPDGRYLKFDEEIGRGSFKTVYRGLDTETGVSVAWCELQENKLNKTERQRFREEAEMLKRLEHSNIVRFYDYWEVTNTKRKYIVLVTELMTSGTLKTYLRRFKKMNTKIVKSWCRQILKGLSFLHSRTPPIIHRDLKCDNIFITGTSGCVKIGDLGLATLKNRSFAKSVIGTPEFMAPEMYDEHYDEKVDVWAFGMCMLEMITAEYPYTECKGPAQIYKKVVHGIKPDNYHKVENSEVREVIDLCIHLKRESRPTIKELLGHEFFAEDLGLKLEIVSREEAVASNSSKILFRLRVTDPNKRTKKYKENEAVQFEYDLNVDNAKEIAADMAGSGHIFDDDVHYIIQMLNSRISSYTRECRTMQLTKMMSMMSAPRSPVGETLELPATPDNFSIPISTFDCNDETQQIQPNVVSNIQQQYTTQNQYQQQTQQLQADLTHLPQQQQVAFTSQAGDGQMIYQQEMHKQINTTQQNPSQMSSDLQSGMASGQASQSQTVPVQQSMQGDGAQYYKHGDSNPQYPSGQQVQYRAENLHSQMGSQSTQSINGGSVPQYSTQHHDPGLPTQYQSSGSLTQPDSNSFQNQPNNAAASISTNVSNVPHQSQVNEYSQPYQYQQFPQNIESNQQIASQQMNMNDANLNQYQQLQPSQNENVSEQNTDYQHQSPHTVGQQPQDQMYHQYGQNTQPAEIISNSYPSAPFPMPSDGTPKEEMYYSSQQNQQIPQFRASQGFGNFQSMNPQEFSELYHQSLNIPFAQANLPNDISVLQQMYAQLQLQYMNQSAAQNLTFNLPPNQQQFQNTNLPQQQQQQQQLYNQQQNLMMQNQQSSAMLGQMESTQLNKQPFNMPFYKMRSESLDTPQSQMPYNVPSQSSDSQNNQKIDPKFMLSQDQMNMMLAALPNLSHAGFMNTQPIPASYSESQPQNQTIMSAPQQSALPPQSDQHQNCMMPSDFGKFQPYLNASYLPNQFPAGITLQQVSQLPNQYIEIMQKNLQQQNHPFANIPIVQLANKLELEAQHFSHPEQQENFVQVPKQMNMMNASSNTIPSELAKQQEFLTQLYHNPELLARVNQNAKANEIVWKMHMQNSLDSSRIAQYMPPSETQNQGPSQVQPVPMFYPYNQVPGNGQQQAQQAQQAQLPPENSKPEMMYPQYTHTPSQYQQFTPETMQIPQHRGTEVDISQQSSTVQQNQQISNQQITVEWSQNVHQPQQQQQQSQSQQQPQPQQQFYQGTMSSGDRAMQFSDQMMPGTFSSVQSFDNEKQQSAQDVGNLQYGQQMCDQQGYMNNGNGMSRTIPSQDVQSNSNDTMNSGIVQNSGEPTIIISDQNEQQCVQSMNNMSSADGTSNTSSMTFSSVPNVANNAMPDASCFIATNLLSSTMEEQNETSNQQPNFDGSVVGSGNVSDRSISVGSNSAAFCSLPQCDTCLALLQSHQISLAPTSTSCVNSVRSQFDHSSHANSQISNKVVYTQPYMCPNNNSSSLVDAQRKISVMSNQSTMSTDSDYVSDTNNLYVDSRFRKFSDIQRPTGEILNYTKPTSLNLNINLSAICSSKSNVKHQSCQTPEFPSEDIDLRNENKSVQSQNVPYLMSEHGSIDDPQRKISNISTISTLSSLSTESASTFDTITTGLNTAGSNEDFCTTREDDNNVRKFVLPGLPQGDFAGQSNDEFDSSKLSSSRSSVVKHRSRLSVPKLNVLSVICDGQVECQLEIAREKTVNFVFNHNEMTASEVADKLLAENVVSTSHLEQLLVLLNELTRQLKEHPDQIPDLNSIVFSPTHKLWDNPDSIASDTESQSNIVDANVNMIYTISSADSHVNVTNLNNSETESSKLTSSNVQNTAPDDENNSQTTTAFQDELVTSTDMSGTADSETSGIDVEGKPRTSNTGSPARKISRFLVSPVIDDLIKQSGAPITSIEGMSTRETSADKSPDAEVSGNTVEYGLNNEGNYNVINNEFTKRDDLYDYSTQHITKSNMSSGRISTCTPPVLHASPESTISSGDHSTFRVSHQGSVDNAHMSGPQTLQDLQQKLAKLTCQPVDIANRSNVSSQIGTPHQQEVSISQNVQYQPVNENVTQVNDPTAGNTSIQQPVISQQSQFQQSGQQSSMTEHSMNSQFQLPTTSTDSYVQQSVSQSMNENADISANFQPVNVPSNSVNLQNENFRMDVDNVAPAATEGTKLADTGNVAQLTSRVQNNNGSEQTKEESGRKKDALDLDNLKQELEKIRGGYKKDSTTTAPFIIGKDQIGDNHIPSTQSDVTEHKPATLPASLHPSELANPTIQRGRFSVTTHPPLHLLNIDVESFHDRTAESMQQQSDLRVLGTDDQSKVPDEHLTYLLQRQQMELQELQRRHREEIDALRQLGAVNAGNTGSLSCIPSLAPCPGTHPRGSVDGYCTAPQSPDALVVENVSPLETAGTPCEGHSSESQVDSSQFSVSSTSNQPTMPGQF